MLLTVATLFLGTRSVLFFLKCISAAKVIGVLVPPFLIEPALLLPAAFSSTTGLLPLLEPRMGMKPATTERAPPPREHTFSPPATSLRRNRPEDAGRRTKQVKGKGFPN